MWRKWRECVGKWPRMINLLRVLCSERVNASLISDFDCRLFVWLIFCFGIQLNPIISDCECEFKRRHVRLLKKMHGTNLSFVGKAVILRQIIQSLACRRRAYLLTPLSAHNSSGYQVTSITPCWFFPSTSIMTRLQYWQPTHPVLSWSQVMDW